jgi:purine-nucleoside phosphorylase
LADAPRPQFLFTAEEQRHSGTIMAIDIYEKAAEAAATIRAQTSAAPRVGIILGSGLGSFAETVDESVVIPYSAIPHFPRPTVEGHRGMLVIGRVAQTPVAVLQGRVHGYEGYTPLETTFPLRILYRLGVDTIIITSASGGLRPDLRPGQLVLLVDQINWTGASPVVGENDSRFGPRFFDMTEVYSTLLRAQAQVAAEQLGIDLREGVYLGVSGPNYETPAEIRAFRAMGADLVGMSVVHEAIVARHMGMRVLGISCVTNQAAGYVGTPVSHAEVIEIAAATGQRLTALLTAILPGLHEDHP